MNPEGIAATKKSSSANSVPPPSTAKSHIGAKKYFFPHPMPSLGSFYTASFELHLVLRGITSKIPSIEKTGRFY